MLSRRFAQTGDYHASAFKTAEEAMARADQVQHNVFGIFLDMMLEDSLGIDAIPALIAHFNPTHLVVMTGYASIATTVSAMKRGATDYVAKPVRFATLLRCLSDKPEIDEVQIKPMTPAQAEWEHIQKVLMENHGNVSRTAEQLGMHRRTLQRKLQKHAPVSHAIN